MTSVSTMPIAGLPAARRASSSAAAIVLASVFSRTVSWSPPDPALAGQHRRRPRHGPQVPLGYGSGFPWSAQYSTIGSRIRQDCSTSSCRGKSGGSPSSTSRMSRS